MPHARYYINDSLSLLEHVKLSKDEELHMLKVLRTRVSEEVELINGRGFLATATLEKDHTLKITKIHYEEKKEPEMVIAQAIPTGSKLDFVIEKATELGVSQIWLFPGKLSEKHEISPTLLKRLETITISACKQSSRLYMPSIKIMPALKSWEFPLPFTLYYGDVDSNAPPFMQKWDKQSFIFVIGPEKGLSLDETHLLKSQQGQGVKLHPNILRTETASLVALSIAHQIIL